MMRSRRLPRVIACLLSAACTAATEPAPATRVEPEAGSKAAAAPTGGTGEATVAAARPEPPLPAMPSLAGAPAVPAVIVTAPGGECPPLPGPAKGAPASQQALAPALAVLRQVSCRPEVFGMARPEVVKELHVPEDMNFEIGRRYASVTPPGPVAVRDVLAALGVKDARMRLRQGWRSTWEVVVGAEAGELRPFGPGVFALRIAGERNDPREGGTLAEIPGDAIVDGGLVVRLPDSVGRFAPDRFAAPAAVAALVTLAQDPGLLALEPEQAHARLATLGERYGLYRYSRGLGAEAFVGLLARPNRTELSAKELADGLGLEGATHKQIQITDTNPNRLAYAGESHFTWHGLELEIELEECEERVFGLAGWCVEGILILPTRRP